MTVCACWALQYVCFCLCVWMWRTVSVCVCMFVLNVLKSTEKVQILFFPSFLACCWTGRWVYVFIVCLCVFFFFFSWRYEQGVLQATCLSPGYSVYLLHRVIEILLVLLEIRCEVCHQSCGDVVFISLCKHFQFLFECFVFNFLWSKSWSVF